METKGSVQSLLVDTHEGPSKLTTLYSKTVYLNEGI